MTHSTDLTSLEICAGAGGQALGIERAGFEHVGAIELDDWAFQTLQHNRPQWAPVHADVRDVRGSNYKGVDLFAGGVPCPPFSVAGKQLGSSDERDLFPAALAWIEETKPKAVLLENVPGLATAKFAPYRAELYRQLRRLGFAFVEGRVLNASEYGVCQLRPRFLIVALLSPYSDFFTWPEPTPYEGTVGSLLYDLMGVHGWPGASAWRGKASRIAPTLVGGSKLHGGPDLGPTRAKQAWRELSVDGNGIADSAPLAETDSAHVPKLTVPMTARVQGFPDGWNFLGRKTAAYRQVGNAFPPPVAHAVGLAIAEALRKRVVGRRAQGGLFAAATY